MWGLEGVVKVRVAGEAVDSGLAGVDRRFVCHSFDPLPEQDDAGGALPLGITGEATWGEQGKERAVRRWSGGMMGSS